MRNERSEVRKSQANTDVNLVGAPEPNYPAALQIEVIDTSRTERVYTYTDPVEAIDAIRGERAGSRWSFPGVFTLYGAALVKAAELVTNSQYIPIPENYRLNLPPVAEALIDIALVAGTFVAALKMQKDIIKDLRWVKKIEQKLRRTPLQLDRVDNSKMIQS